MPIGIKGTTIYWFHWATNPGEVNHEGYKAFVQFVRKTAVNHEFTTVEKKIKQNTPQKIEKRRDDKALKRIQEKKSGKR